MIDWGCGDGEQLALAEYPRYLGIDRSATAVRMCIRRFREDPSKSFLAFEPDTFTDQAGWLAADLALSLEVIFHLTEAPAFEDHMARLFDSADRFVAICANDSCGTEQVSSERHWRFTEWVGRERPEWRLVDRVDPPEGVRLMSSLYLFEAAGRRSQ